MSIFAHEKQNLNQNLFIMFSSTSALTGKMKALYATVGAAVGAGVVAAGMYLFNGSDAYVNVIPESADIVARMNVAELADGSGLNSDEGKKILKKLTESAGADASNSKLLKRIQDDPASLGLRLDKDAYVFADLEKGEECGALVVGMYKQDNVKESIEMLADEVNEKMKIVEHDGMNWVEGKNKTKDFAFAYDSDMLIISFGNDAEDNVLKWKDQGSDDRYCKTERWNKLQGVGGQLAIDMNYGCIPNMKETDDMMKEMYGIRMKDLSIAMGWEIKPGETSMTAEVYSDNERFAERMKQGLECISNMDAVYAESVPENYLVWGGFNVHGENLLNMLNDIETMKQAIAKVEKEAGVKIADFVNDLDGDMAFCVTSELQKLDIPSMYFNAQVKNEKYLQNVLNIIKGKAPMVSQLVQKKGADYVIAQEGETIANMGVKDGKNLFITNANAPYSKKTSALDNYMSDIKNSCQFYIVNFPNIAKLIPTVGSKDNPDVKLAVDILKHFAVAIVKSGTDGKCTATLKFKNDGDYAVSIISDIYDSYMAYLDEQSKRNAELDIYEYDDADDYDYDEIDSVAVDEDFDIID